MNSNHALIERLQPVKVVPFDMSTLEERMFDALARNRECSWASYGRCIRIGQIWRHNDPRRLRGVRIIGLTAEGDAMTENIVTGKLAEVPRARFTIGREGCSLEKEAA